MKKFSFPLERARTWKRSVWEQEESKLERLIAQMQLIDQRRGQLIADIDAAVRRAAARSELSAEDLSQLDHAQKYAREEDRRLTQRQQKVAAEVECQRGVVREARRQYELLDRLRDAQFRQWALDLAREQETQIGDLTIARWRRERAGS